MTERRTDPSTVYDAWKRALAESGSLIVNDGRMPDGTLVWTPYVDDNFDDADYTAGRAPAGYCSPEWTWYQGRIIGQSDTNWWFVFLNHEGLPFLCQRHFAELRHVTQAN